MVTPATAPFLSDNIFNFPTTHTTEWVMENSQTESPLASTAKRKPTPTNAQLPK